jgi:hypothetical protein
MLLSVSLQPSESLVEITLYIIPALNNVGERRAAQTSAAQRAKTPPKYITLLQSTKCLNHNARKLPILRQIYGLLFRLFNKTRLQPSDALLLSTEFPNVRLALDALGDLHDAIVRLI